MIRHSEDAFDYLYSNASSHKRRLICENDLLKSSAT